MTEKLPTPEKGKAGPRVTIELGEIGEEMAQNCLEATEAPTKSAVVRNALAAYQVLVEKIAADPEAKVWTGVDREHAHEVLVPQLENVRRKAKREKR